MDYYLHLSTSDEGGDINYFELLKVDGDNISIIYSPIGDTFSIEDFIRTLRNISNTSDRVYSFNGAFVNDLLHNIYPNISEHLHRGSVLSIMDVFHYYHPFHKFNLDSICNTYSIDVTMKRSIKYYYIHKALMLSDRKRT